MDEFKGDNRSPGQNAWDLFTMSGNVGYYLLYKELSGGHDDTPRQTGM